MIGETSRGLEARRSILIQEIAGQPAAGQASTQGPIDHHAQGSSRHLPCPASVRAGVSPPALPGDRSVAESLYWNPRPGPVGIKKRCRRLSNSSREISCQSSRISEVPTLIGGSWAQLNTPNSRTCAQGMPLKS